MAAEHVQRDRGNAWERRDCEERDQTSTRVSIRRDAPLPDWQFGGARLDGTFRIRKARPGYFAIFADGLYFLSGPQEAIGALGRRGRITPNIPNIGRDPGGGRSAQPAGTLVGSSADIRFSDSLIDTAVVAKQPHCFELAIRCKQRFKPSSLLLVEPE